MKGESVLTFSVFGFLQELSLPYLKMHLSLPVDLRIWRKTGLLRTKRNGMEKITTSWLLAQLMFLEFCIITILNSNINHLIIFIPAYLQERRESIGYVCVVDLYSPWVLSEHLRNIVLFSWYPVGDSIPFEAWKTRYNHLCETLEHPLPSVHFLWKWVFCCWGSFRTIGEILGHTLFFVIVYV